MRTGHGIPIRNLWHMLLYAWDELPAARPLTFQEVESAPTLDALFALLLIRSMQQRMRVGLGHAYVHQEENLRGIRGRINFSESLRQHLFEKGETDCEFQQYSINEPRNQIVKSTLVKLIQTGEFGPVQKEADALRHRLRWLVRSLDGIELVEISPELIGRQLLAQNDRDYRLMLSVCELLLLGRMPLEVKGTHSLPGLDRDALILHRIYERFVAGFYRQNLKGWKVNIQKRLEWHAQGASEHLPFMIPDLVLEDPRGGLMILDTKFTAGSLVENQWGKPVYDSGHLYQLYTYLRSQEHLSQAYQAAAGILLYPALQAGLSEAFEVQGHLIRMESVNLAAPWQDVEKQLLELMERP